MLKHVGTNSPNLEFRDTSDTEGIGQVMTGKTFVHTTTDFSTRVRANKRNTNIHRVTQSVRELHHTVNSPVNASCKKGESLAQRDTGPAKGSPGAPKG